MAIEQVFLQCQIKDLKNYWTSFNTNSQNMPSHNPSYMSVLQVVLFVYFPFMNPTQRALWSSMCVLGSYIIQTRTEDLEDSIRENQKAIENFIYYVINISPQWVNKPKFYMLFHLAASVRRFGPPTLAGKIYSNHQSCGGYLKHFLKLSSHALNSIRCLYKLMGLNETEDIQDIPEISKLNLIQKKLRQVSPIRISDHFKVENQYFVVVPSGFSFQSTNFDRQH
ncbi:hypothetical protein VP01_1388g3 [Puccinia sorghi]|uniref:Uncharacterized protein n=1 Tax=Puccinia sorghi TaxID=27349 RepID=A0A0L6VN42_9BASI|nr:hypothetical protein VP01_1388g3 [Puccinia sorghi]